VLADDLGYGDLGFQGAKDIPTPHLDQLARTGVRFSNGYVSHPFCSPTRAGLLTGRYQQRFGHENNPKYDPRDEVAGLPKKETTLADVLQRAGYITGHVGKWHLGATPGFHPVSRGFTDSFGFLGGGHDYFEQQMEGEPREYLIPLHRNRTPVAESEYLTDALSREAAAFVEQNKARPFLLYLAYNTPHTPLQVPEKYLSRFAGIADEKRRKYAAMVSSLDDGVGRLMGALAKAGIEENTVVFFLSDNGGPVGINGSTNTPLRGAKGSVYEGGIRVPFVARWKGRWKPGVRKDVVTSLDLFPTIAGLAGAVVPPEVRLDGVDLSAQLGGRPAGSNERRLFWRTGGGASFAMREGNYKLVRPPGSTKAELYDLAADVAESKDLAAAQPARVKRMQAALDQWNKGLIAPLFESPRPAAGKKKN
jgi:arylsulfatase A-like enzyme